MCLLYRYLFKAKHKKIAYSPVNKARNSKNKKCRLDTLLKYYVRKYMHYILKTK